MDNSIFKYSASHFKSFPLSTAHWPEVAESDGFETLPRLFQARISERTTVSGNGEAWLSAQEKMDLSRMGSSRRRTEFLSGRALLRRALLEVGVPDGNWEVGASRGGKPVLVAAPASPFHSPLPDFSISHGAGMVVCAVAAKGCVGMDIERISPRRATWAEFARRVLHPVEERALANLDETLRWQGLYRAWTLKEAIGKALGLGLALPFREVAIAKDDASLLALPDVIGMEPSDWRLFSFQPEPGYLAATAWHPTLRLPDVQLANPAVAAPTLSRPAASSHSRH